MTPVGALRPTYSPPASSSNLTGACALSVISVVKSGEVRLALSPSELIVTSTSDPLLSYTSVSAFNFP